MDNLNQNADNTAQKQKRTVGRPFKPGQSGNPAGRPKGSLSLTALMKQELERVPEEGKPSYALAFVKKALHKAIVDGDTQMIRTIWSYIDGMPVQSHEIAGIKSPNGEIDTDKLGAIKNIDDVRTLIEETINNIRTNSVDIQAANNIARLASIALKAIEISELDKKMDLVNSVIQERRAKTRK